MTPPIDTGTATRRQLRFDRIEQVLAELDRLAAAESAGKLKCCGNWEFGQICNHLAAWVEYAYIGAPLKPPWPIKMLMRVLIGKDKFINSPMRAGVKIPRTQGGTLATEVVETQSGLGRYRAALARLQREAPQKPQVIFGPFTHDEWIRPNLRHAELHLSFVDVQQS